MEREVSEVPKMYICDVCGEPTPNYREYSPSMAAILGKQGYSTCDGCLREAHILHKWRNEQYAEDEDEIECPECGRTFEVEIATVYTYRTRRRKEDMPDGWNGGEL